VVVREIKFRVWDGARHCFRNFNDLKFGARGVWAVVYYDPERGHVVQEMAHLQLMQYTGLHDRNGVEIYEGDILHYVAPPEHDDGSGGIETYEVVWKDFGFTARWLQARWERAQWIENALHGAAEDMEVIGNVYEHPELLERADA
jgi:uncharacterized phage protein (TIGR01671 family)